MFKYIKLADILKDVVEHNKQLKNVLYHSKQIKPTQIPSTYSLLSLLLNNFNQIKQCVQEIANKSKTSIINPYLTMIMIGQFINTGKIVGGGKLKRVVMDHQHLIPLIAKSSKINKQIVQIRLRSNDSKFNSVAKHLAEISKQDQIVPNLYHLQHNSYSELTKDETLHILENSACVMQSFSSALPPYLLMRGVSSKWKGRKFDVIDACAAPGNKTIQLAEYIGEQGRVFAFQKNQKRCELLNRTIAKYEVKNIKSMNYDFLLIDSNHKKYRKVKFVLLDPSCSGSGMLTNFTRDGNQSKGEEETVLAQTFQQFCNAKYLELDERQKSRVQNLHNFQVQLLNHAAKFKPKRLSYSTCSIYQRQNEDVVKQFLRSHPEYKIKQFNILKKNENIREGFGDDFKSCIRLDPRSMQTDGFFVTVFSLIAV